MYRDDLLERLGDLKPEFNVVKSAVTGGIDLRFFDASMDKTYSTELIPPDGIGDVTLQTVMVDASERIVQTWLKDCAEYVGKEVTRV